MHFISYFYLPITERHALKYPIMILNSCISICSSINNYFVCDCEALLLTIYVLNYNCCLVNSILLPCGDLIFYEKPFLHEKI